MWSVLVQDPSPWVMYRVFLSALMYAYLPDVWRVLCVSYAWGSLTFVLGFALDWMSVSFVHLFFTYPVAVLVGVFVSRAVPSSPSPYPALHALSVLPWTVLGFYGPVGYLFALPFLLTLAIARMYRLAAVSGASMVLCAALIPLTSPLVSLCVPVMVLFVFEWLCAYKG